MFEISLKNKCGFYIKFLVQNAYLLIKNFLLNTHLYNFNFLTNDEKNIKITI